jgi:hypothetical protein
MLASVFDHYCHLSSRLRDMRRAKPARRKEAQMQYRIALMSKTLLQRGRAALTVRHAGKPRLYAQDTRAFEEYNP